MLSDEQFMQLAIEEAKKSLTSGGAPIGAVIVKDGRVVAKGRSLVLAKKDPSAHAEMECIRAACEKLQTLDINGCTLYSTLESCAMCMGCASYAALKAVIFGASKEDVPEAPYDLSEYSSEEHSKKLSNKIEVRGGVLREDCKKLLENFVWKPESK